MKKHAVLFLVLLLLLIAPLYASSSKDIYLNNLLYQPIHKVLMIKNTAYISLDDLNALTYGSYTLKDKNLEINLNGKKIKAAVDSRIFRTGNDTLTLSAPITSIADIVYVPADFLALVQYPYKETDTSLSFDSPIPYSSSTDRYIDHKLILSGEINLRDSVLASSTTPEEGAQLIHDAIKNGSYLIVPSKSPSPALLSAMKENLKADKPMEIVVRQSDFLSKVPSQSALKTVPIAPVLDNGKISLQIEDDKLTSTFFELAFKPDDAANVIDSNKTFDAILMRLIYAHYRDYYHLKDDIHFSPVGTMAVNRSDSMHFKVYLDEVLDSSPSTYDMIISKQIHENRISYVVDFVKLS